MLAISRSHYQLIINQARTGLPKETCGLIAGAEQSGRRIVKYVYPLTNTDDSEEHFAMDPREQFAAVKDMRQNGWVLLGNYHSHPASPARPSAEDISLAFDMNMSYLIISLQHLLSPVLRSYRISNGAVTEELIQIIEGDEEIGAS